MGENKMINKQGLTEEQFLTTYDASKYERPSVTVDMLIFTVFTIAERISSSFDKLNLNNR